VANSLVFLVSTPSVAGAWLRDRLNGLGFECVLTSDPVSAASSDALPAVLLVVGSGKGSSAGPLLPKAREGTALEGVPVIRLLESIPGAHSGLMPGPGSAAGVDETLPPDLDDETLTGRLRVWARWGEMAHRLRALESRGREEGGEDGPSNLPGYPRFMERLGLEVKRHERYGAPLGLVLADIDGLREINARYGHRTGDMIIRHVAESLESSVRQTDSVFHYEGDTFAILLTHSTEEATGKAVERLRSLIAGRIFRGEAEGSAPSPLLKITMRFGYASLPATGISGQAALLAAVEESLKRAISGQQQSSIRSGPS
jgi:diguanylate cyclase (GGDEF)-like protein